MNSSLLKHTLNQVSASDLEKTYIVLGSNSSKYLEVSEQFGVPIVFPEWKLGMGASLKFGLRTILNMDEADAIMITVCDQPGIQTLHLNKLLSVLKSRNDLIASSYAETIGVPAVIGRAYFDEILNISDTSGAKSILITHREKVRSFPMEDGELDIDTPSDLNQLAQYAEKKKNEDK